MKLAVTGATGKTGYRVVEEAIKSGYKVRLVIRKDSIVPNNLKNCEIFTVNLAKPSSIDMALQGCDALVIATGARPSIDLTGPARVDALGVKRQVESCKRVGLKRIILVSSLCAGQFFHPLNLFGLILIWKRIGEQALQKSGLDWTVIRPGGLNENEDGLDKQAIIYTKENQQKDAYIPRRLVAKCCIDSLKTKESIGKIVEVTSSSDVPMISMAKAIKGFTI